MKTIQPRDLQAMIAAGQNVELIDVRTPGEFEQVHAATARLVPLSQLDPRKLMEARSGRSSEPIYVICRSGSRSTLACQKLIAAGCKEVVNVEGGTDAWVSAGLPVVRGRSKVLPLESQVRIAAGLFVLIGLALGWYVSPLFLILCALVGAGLVFSGVTGSCCAGMLLARMPWNRGCNQGTC